MAPQSDNAPVVVKGLRKSFGDQIVLDGIDLSVKDGETVAILGRSGTGKSVFLKLLIRLETADAGSIRILGNDIIAVDRNQLSQIRKKMGFLFQQAALYDSLNIQENVEFPLRHNMRLPVEERRNRAKELLSSVGMSDHLDKLPSQISGGMQKRVGLARALALDPEILLFDEPTSGLDPITAEEIGELIQALKQKRSLTIVMVTHDLQVAKKVADRFVLIDKGNIVTEGSFKDLMKSDDPLARRFLNG
jgi:phospholipid/cholesterol/gamma-HCH transport system ATP-binding protein